MGEFPIEIHTFDILSIEEDNNIIINYRISGKIYYDYKRPDPKLYVECFDKKGEWIDEIRIPISKIDSDYSFNISGSFETYRETAEIGFSSDEVTYY